LLGMGVRGECSGLPSSNSKFYDTPSNLAVLLIKL